MSEYCPDNAYTVLALNVRNALLGLHSIVGFTLEEWRKKVLLGYADVPSFHCGRSRGNCPFIQYRITPNYDLQAVDGGSITFSIDYQVWSVTNCEYSEREAQKIALQASNAIKSMLAPQTGVGDTIISQATRTASKMIFVDCSLEVEQSYTRDQYNIVPLDDIVPIGNPAAGDPIDRLHDSVYSALTSSYMAKSVCDCYIGDWTSHVFEGLRDTFAGFSSRNKGNVPYLEFDIQHILNHNAIDGGSHTATISLRAHYANTFDLPTQSENANKIITTAVMILDNYFSSNHVNVVNIQFADPVVTKDHFILDAAITCEFSYEEQ